MSNSIFVSVRRHGPNRTGYSNYFCSLEGFKEYISRLKISELPDHLLEVYPNGKTRRHSVSVVVQEMIREG